MMMMREIVMTRSNDEGDARTNIKYIARARIHIGKIQKTGVRGTTQPHLAED